MKTENSERKQEQGRILAGMKAYGMKGRAVDDQWVCDVSGCDQDAHVQSVTPPTCPRCGSMMLQVLVEGEPIVLS